LYVGLGPTVNDVLVGPQTMRGVMLHNTNTRTQPDTSDTSSHNAKN